MVSQKSRFCVGSRRNPGHSICAVSDRIIKARSDHRPEWVHSLSASYWLWFKTECWATLLDNIIGITGIFMPQNTVAVGKLTKKKKNKNFIKLNKKIKLNKIKWKIKQNTKNNNNKKKNITIVKNTRKNKFANYSCKYTSWQVLLTELKK